MQYFWQHSIKKTRFSISFPSFLGNQTEREANLEDGGNGENLGEGEKGGVRGGLGDEGSEGRALESRRSLHEVLDQVRLLLLYVHFVALALHTQNKSNSNKKRTQSKKASVWEREKERGFRDSSVWFLRGRGIGRWVWIWVLGCEGSMNAETNITYCYCYRCCSTESLRDVLREVSLLRSFFCWLYWACVFLFLFFFSYRVEGKTTLGDRSNFLELNLFKYHNFNSYFLKSIIFNCFHPRSKKKS